MKAISTLKQIVRESIPNFQSLPQEQKEIAVRGILSASLLDILQKIKLPQLIVLRIQLQRERFLDQRRRKGYKGQNRQINFALWKLIYDAKRQLNFDVHRTTEFETEYVENITTPAPSISKTISSNSLWSMLKTSPASYSLSSTSTEVSYFRVQKTLEDKILNNSIYSSFISSLDTTCRSDMIKALGFAEFYLHEKYMEPPKKNKIILDVKFYQSNVEKCIEQWEILRDIVDTSIKKLKINSHDKEKIEELEKQFYIRLAY